MKLHIQAKPSTVQSIINPKRTLDLPIYSMIPNAHIHKTQTLRYIFIDYKIINLSCIEPWALCSAPSKEIEIDTDTPIKYQHNN